MKRETRGAERKNCKPENRLLNQKGRENWTNEETMAIVLKREQDTPLKREMRKTTT